MISADFRGKGVPVGESFIDCGHVVRQLRRNGPHGLMRVGSLGFREGLGQICHPKGSGTQIGQGFPHLGACQVKVQALGPAIVQTHMILSGSRFSEVFPPQGNIDANGESLVPGG